MITLEDLSVADFPEGVSQARDLLERVFGWAAGEPDLVEIKPVQGGITNSLLTCINTSTQERVLVRLYGRSTDTIIDRQRELVAHQMLHELKLASKLYARFANGIVYGFIRGRSLSFEQLPQYSNVIAPHLKDIHDKFDIQAFKSQIDGLCEIWPIMSSWVNQLEDEQLQEELAWLKSTLEGTSPNVACHSDLLAGNIIIEDQNKVNFIDYEYLMIGPRAFDIANHLMEWQGFECQTERIPEVGSSEVRLWCQHYLNTQEKSQIDAVVEELKLHYGLPGFFWGVWAKIQAKISALDFDYKSYSELRLKEYWNWKSTLNN